MLDPIRPAALPVTPVIAPKTAPTGGEVTVLDGFTRSQNEQQGNAPINNVQPPPPAQQPAPIGRPMTDDEKADFKSWFPNLDVETSRVTHEATPQYNCISWTTGNTQSWDWPPSMYDGDPVDCFTQYYTERGFVPISAEDAATIGKDRELVAYWEDPNGPTHGSVSGPIHGERWESKCGQAAQITHGRDELESEVYGAIKGYWIKPEAQQQPPTQEQPPVFRELAPDVKQRLEAKLALRCVMVDPQVAKSFDAAYSQWQQDRKSPGVMMSSNPKDYLRGEGYQKMLALGQEALPLWMNKMAQGDFFCQYAVQDLTRQTDGAFKFEGVNPQPELRAREKRVSEQDKARQIMAQWLESQW